MSRGDWGVVVTIGGCLALAWVAVLDSHQRGYREPRSTSERQGPSQFERNRRGIPTPFEAFTANPDPQNTDEREKRDLAAQETSAAWAFWVALFSGLQLVTTIIGLYFVKRTLDATLMAVQDTGEATMAMKESNEIMRETAKHQLRAYLDFDSVRYNVSPNCPDTETQIGTGIRIKVKNYGTTPAKNAVLKYICYVESQNGDLLARAGEDRTEMTSIAPADEFIYSFYFRVDRNRWKDIQQRRATICIRTKVDYCDVFNEPQSLSSLFISDGLLDQFSFKHGTRHAS